MTSMNDDMYNWYAMTNMLCLICTYDAWYITHMIKMLWLIFMPCYDMLHVMDECSVNFVY